ncbi:MAG: ABC transporter substrate-binding protein [Planctomycetota bacterium]
MDRNPSQCNPSLTLRVFPDGLHPSLAVRVPDGLYLVFYLLLALISGCAERERPPEAEAGAVVLQAWFHSGRQDERRTIQNQIERFNDSQDEVYIQANVIPEDTYNGQVQSAAVAGDLPDVLEFDGPFLYNYVWQGNLRPLGDRIGQEIKSDLLPSIVKQGTFQDKFYAVGTFDAGLGIFGRRSVLESVGARIPAGPSDAWTVSEFEDILGDLAKEDPDGAVLDLKLNYEGEWYTYAFSPVLQSAGGGLIDRPDYQSAEGVFNGAASVEAMGHLQSWIESGYVDPNIDDAAFTQGRVALSWSGHWDYPRYADAAGDDLVVLPLPDFGTGTKTGQGSWCWGMTSNCEHPDAAARFIRFLLQPDEMLAMVDANGAPPARRAAVARSRLYGKDGPLRIFATQLAEGYSVPRPRTPAYPTITDVFQRAFQDIRNGAAVQATLDRAAATIDEDIRANDGYALPE